MEWVNIGVIALGLSFDSFAVSVSCGIYDKKMRFLQAFHIAFWLALFQGVMPLLGWLAGLPLRSLLSEIDHWIAFALLCLIGGKMIFEAIISNESKKIKQLSLWVIWGMALATSLDALAVGFSFALTETPVVVAALIIAFVTGVASMIGMLFGKNIKGNKLKYIEMAGGIILILIGAKILYEHISVS
ncbi:MAG: hypothetical protein CVU05_09115 [Bacteroidetes bacterium HGW-Bacteroidetes-21]|jgi:putative Mn2+ efflux pump MntP|nr:MAG: hypothetical protein CVU05_09115 [Bacteroidetes bacterium HGW-Bacteroidetes-21]